MHTTGKGKKKPIITTVRYHDVTYPISLCMTCGAALEAGYGPDKKPRPGDVSLCVYCRTLSIFDATLRLRPPTEDEAAELAADEDVQKAIRVAERTAEQIGQPPKTARPN